jgi:hypothetical protein
MGKSDEGKENLDPIADPAGNGRVGVRGYRDVVHCYLGFIQTNFVFVIFISLHRIVVKVWCDINRGRKSRP